MSTGTINTGALSGVEAFPVQVTATVTDGLPSFAFVGAMGEAAVRESRVRVQAAIVNAGFLFPTGRVTVEIKAGRGKVDGTGFDLPIALAVLEATGQIPQASLALVAFGELGLNGDVRPVRGAMVLASLGADVLCAFENGAEAALTSRAVTVRTLKDAATFCATGTGGEAFTAPTLALSRETRQGSVSPDFADIRGQGRAKRAAEIAAAGGHSLMLTGGPGAGKTMIARRIPGILPNLTEGEAREVTAVHSSAGLNIGGGLVSSRPFRAPHHSTTTPGLVGGGASVPRPGEVTLAHHGVLFLDETPEFSRQTLEVLREPLMTGEVTLARSSGTLRYPSRAMLVGSRQPCPCGRFGDARQTSRTSCHCSPESRIAYRKRSTSVEALCDVRCEVDPVNLADIETAPKGEDSATIRARVVAARERQTARGCLNAGRIDLDRVSRVALTIADLAGTDVTEAHRAEAESLTK